MVLRAWVTIAPGWVAIWPMPLRVSATALRGLAIDSLTEVTTLPRARVLARVSRCRAERLPGSVVAGPDGARAGALVSVERWARSPCRLTTSLTNCSQIKV